MIRPNPRVAGYDISPEVTAALAARSPKLLDRIDRLRAAEQLRTASRIALILAAAVPVVALTAAGAGVLLAALAIVTPASILTAAVAYAGSVILTRRAVVATRTLERIVKRDFGVRLVAVTGRQVTVAW